MLLWTMPVPVTALFYSPRFSMLQGRTCSLALDFEGEDYEPQKVTLFFQGVEIFKCTYMTSCTAEMFDIAYGKVVDLGQTNWLAAIPKSAGSDLKHLMITFDDGPCYEFVCQTFKAEQAE